MSVSLPLPHASTITVAQPLPSGALLTVALAAPAESPYLALTITRSGDDTDPDAAQTLPTLHLTPDDFTALCTALGRVARAHDVMG